QTMTSRSRQAAYSRCVLSMKDSQPSRCEIINCCLWCGVVWCGVVWCVFIVFFCWVVGFVLFSDGCVFVVLGA
ncbi:TPA: hypothetical protein ACGTJ1_005098, partial [Escherichia coli]